MFAMRSITPAICLLPCTAMAQSLTLEPNVHDRGQSYKTFVPVKPVAEACRRACASAQRCLAYTFVRPSKTTPYGRCDLKAQLSKRTTDTCCISGRKPERQHEASKHRPVVRHRLPGKNNPARTLLPSFGKAAAITLPQSVKEKLSNPDWLKKYRKYASDRRWQSVPLTQREAEQSRFGPVLEPCPEPPTAQERREREEAWQQKYTQYYRECLSAATRGAGDLPSHQQQDQCHNAADGRVRTERRQAERVIDQDGDGTISHCYGGLDCDDTLRNRYTGNAEVTDANHTDEDCNPATLGSEDRDGDGFLSERSCNWDGQSLVCGTDCNDLDALINPDQQDICDGKDNNCNALVDENLRNCS